jgi:glyoxylase-like metal-dependent hydrolase (beta-lactamase superfamily II)
MTDLELPPSSADTDEGPAPHIDAFGVGVLDAHHVRPGVLACHLLRNGRDLGLVDVGPNPSVPHVLAGLRRLGLDPVDVTHVFVTHVHLDHAGGVGKILPELPRARVYVHPAGARHLARPERLEQATRDVYGDARYERYFGTLVPVPEDRLVGVADGDRLRFGTTALEVVHTLGHARHHYCLYEPEAGTLFAGDNFGIAYRTFVSERGSFAFPSTTPTQFDPDEARASLKRLLAFAPRALYVAHYSRVDDPPRLADELAVDLDAYVALARETAAETPGPSGPARLRARLATYTHERLRAHRCALAEETIDAWLATDLELNALGLWHWLSRREAK